MEDALMVLCWLSIAGPLLDSCRQVCRQSAGGGPLMEGILGNSITVQGVSYAYNESMTRVHIRRELRLDDAVSVCQFDHIVEMRQIVDETASPQLIGLNRRRNDMGM